MANSEELKECGSCNWWERRHDYVGDSLTIKCFYDDGRCNLLSLARMGGPLVTQTDKAYCCWAWAKRKTIDPSSLSSPKKKEKIAATIEVLTAERDAALARVKELEGSNITYTYHIEVKQLDAENEHYWLASIAELNGLHGYGGKPTEALEGLAGVWQAFVKEEDDELGMSGVVIYKYPLESTKGIVASLMLPEGAEIISVAGQREAVVVYAIVDPSKYSTIHHTFYIVPTGHPLCSLPTKDFLGTVSLCNGDLMFHIFHGGFDGSADLG